MGTIFCPSSTVSDSPGYCTASCSACQPEGTSSGATVTCFNCFFGAPAGSCALTADQCPQTLHGAACSCLDGGGCPGATQTCEHDDAGAPVCISH